MNEKVRIPLLHSHNLRPQNECTWFK